LILQHVYEVRPRKDKLGVDLICNALPLGRLCGTRKSRTRLGCAQLGCAQFYSRSHHVVIRVYDDAGNLIETHQHKGEFKEV
jgi:hypothetical protein